MPPWLRLPGVSFDGDYSEAFVELSDGDSEAVSAPAAVTHERFESVAIVVGE
ncbi:MAG: hypothetical protein ACRDUS_20580 [Mycobacterium sp.]